MPESALTSTQAVAAQLIGAGMLAAIGMFFLLPRLRGRNVTVGTFLCLAATAVAVLFLVTTFGQPTPDLIGTILFWLFSVGAVGFGAVLVAQANPGRGAIAFAFVVLSTCGLFLLLAAPFLMATTVIVYAGAIIVTFLFVLMLSQSAGPSDENDRSREPLLGGLAGFGFAGLVLFALHQSLPHSDATPVQMALTDTRLPLAPLTPAERQTLLDVAAKLETADGADRDTLLSTEFNRDTRDRLDQMLGGESDSHGRPPLQRRLAGGVADPRVAAVIARADALRDRTRATFDTLETSLIEAKSPADEAAAKAALRALRDDVIVLAGVGGLPARNVGGLGTAVYTEHLLAVEMAGTLLLVATIGAVAIAHRRRAGA